LDWTNFSTNWYIEVEIVLGAGKIERYREENVLIEERYREVRNALVLWDFAGTKHFERYREENVIGRNVIESFHCMYGPPVHSTGS